MGSVWKWITDGIGFLLGSFKVMAATIVARVLAAFGLSMVTFEALLPNLKAFVLQFVSGMPADMLNFLGAIGLGQAMSMIFSALTVRLAWKVFIVPSSVAGQLP